MKRNLIHGSPVSGLLVATALFVFPLTGCESVDPDLDETTVAVAEAQAIATTRNGQWSTPTGNAGNGVTKDVRVGGNIQGEGALTVNVGDDSIVEGNIQLKRGFAVAISDVRIDGDLQLESNAGGVDANRNVVGGNMQVFQNAGGVLLRENRVAENLQCKSNTPAPEGGDNIAGNKEDQCAAL